MHFSLEKSQVAIVGLGYVGLPLAVAFSKKLPVIGYDVSASRVEELKRATDRTKEVSAEQLHAAKGLSFTTDAQALSAANVYIMTTPTPIDEHKNPDLGAVLGATREVARSLGRGDVVIYESTVYPGVTEEECVPVLEEVSGLTFNSDFFVGYSPERINPGDKVNRLESIIKITSASTPEAAAFVDDLYRLVVEAGTHKAPSIKVAEAAKVIENTQRDVNIALVNELAIIFGKLGIDTGDVLEAAESKWNFLPFKPGLVGGHCIGVDPYYLTHKAQAVGHHPEIILAGRRLNDSMGAYVASTLMKSLLQRKPGADRMKVLVLGLTFKENTPDLRNTRVVDVVRELREYGIEVDVFDPWVSSGEAMAEYGITLTQDPEENVYDALLLAVAHKEFVDLGASGVRKFGRPKSLLFDLKGAFPKEHSDIRL